MIQETDSRNASTNSWRRAGIRVLPASHFIRDADMEEIMNTFKSMTKVVGALAGIALSGMPLISQAEDAPPANVAEPGVYKLVAENDLFKVMVMTWQPGQKDAFHSHTANAVYHLTDCDRKIFRPDGTMAKEGSYKAGSAVLQNPVSSHSFQNVSDHVCQSVIVERK